MNLRGRITLFVCLSVLALVGGMRGVEILRERAAESRRAAALETGVRNTWNGLTEIGLRRLDETAPILARDAAIVGALARGDKPALRVAVGRAVTVVSGNRAPPAVEVTDGGGAIAHNSENANRPQLLTSAVLDHLGPISVGVRGVAVNANGKATLAVIQPIFGDDGRLGTIAVFIDLEPTLDDLARATGSSVFATRGDGVPVAGADAARKVDLDAFVPPKEPVGLWRRGERVLEVVHFPVPDLTRAGSLDIVTASDVTRTARYDDLVDLVSRGVTLGAFALLLAFLYWYMRISFKPLNTVIRVLNALSRGNTRVSLALKPGKDEIGRLAGTVETFRRGQEANRKLMSLRQELELARNIQASFLSTDFPLMETLEIHATMNPAKEVGGDFYDFFELPDDRFGVVIADVSGKGVGAAMFMAVARTVVRSTALMIPDPGACLAQANDLLSRENNAAMFVTLFYGVVDTRTGVMSYANAGHNPPVRVTRDGRAEMIQPSGDVALGVMDGLEYGTGTLALAPGEALLLYTDGVTEAFNPTDEPYGEGRLLDILSKRGGASAETIVTSLVADVAEFVAGAPQSDDLTSLALCYRPRVGV